MLNLITLAEVSVTLAVVARERLVQRQWVGSTTSIL